FDYQPLARQLKGTRTVYGLPCRMLADPAHRDVSLNQMAEDYCAMIRATQPEGPYHLLGWSLGGTLVAMMTALLEADGQAVAFLGLVDPYIPGTESSQPGDWRRDFVDFVSAIIPGIVLDDTLKAALPDQSSEMPSKQAIIDLLEKLLSVIRQAERQAGRDTELQGYITMGTEELAQIFIVARHLKTLSMQVDTLSSLTTPATCWWAMAREHADRLVLQQQIRPTGIHSIEIDAGHFDIVRTELLLLDIQSMLAVVLSDQVYNKEIGLVK
ncbi:MAG: thioesterase domain-containing protein, partial [Rubrivivax sp.]|nr:thioesterase domain-containing protein [Rubrivivax sp.]